MASRLKTIYDINSVERLSKFLNIGFKIPVWIGVLIGAVSYLFFKARISTELPALLFILIYSPPVLFTPFILYVLFKEHRYGWLTAYILFVILPAITPFIFTAEGIVKALWIPLFILPFYLFSFFMRFSVNDWIKEYYWEQELLRQKAEAEENMKNNLL